MHIDKTHLTSLKNVRSFIYSIPFLRKVIVYIPVSLLSLLLSIVDFPNFFHVESLLFRVEHSVIRWRYFLNFLTIFSFLTIGNRSDRKNICLSGL